MHGERSELCEKCETEDVALNGFREEHQCQHPIIDMDGYCLDCQEFCE